MQNLALWEVVRVFETHEAQKRLVQQQKLKKEALAVAAAAVVSSSSSSSGAGASAGAMEATVDEAKQETAVVEAAAVDIVVEDEEEEDEDDHIQQHLLSHPNARWVCLEDSQQAQCLAVNRRKTMFAVGERDGRVSIWDNVSIRVITRELDPTVIALPVKEHEAKAAADTSGDSAATATKESNDDAPVANEPDMQLAISTDAVESGETSVEGDDDSATNDDDGSVQADDDEDETESVEDGDVATEEDEEEDDEEDEDENDNQAPSAASTRPPSPVSPSRQRSKQAIPSPRHLTADGSDAAELVTLSLAEISVVKENLKVVTSLAWSCDSRWIVAGCEEKSNRRGRLCVWDVEAALLVSTFRSVFFVCCILHFCLIFFVFLSCCSFDAVINCVDAHPSDPELVLVSYFNALPVLLNVRSRVMTTLDAPIVNSTLTVTPQANSRHPSLIACAKYGTSGNWIYCVTSKATVSIFDSKTLELVHSVMVPVIIQYVDLSINFDETALLFTSSKGIHEYAVTSLIAALSDSNSNDKYSIQRRLEEGRIYSTGAVRAPWAVCCFSGEESFVVGTPVVRHRHVGENGLYTWHRVTGRVQHNIGVKDGVNGVVWDNQRESILAVSINGAVFVMEEQYKTSWAGSMYPAGFRLVTDNEFHSKATEEEQDDGFSRVVQDIVMPVRVANDEPIDVFSAPVMTSAAYSVPACKQAMPAIVGELRVLPSIPIYQHLKRHLTHSHLAHVYHEEKHFGLGQSIFEPFKVPAKPQPSSSRKRKKSITTATATADGLTALSSTTAAKSSAKKSKSSSQKRRRR